ncbi:hypothetical protein EalM132_00178 [Exiguobacterium phage vB_EalM-132]|nr:hypothetical protein EalM132_00008 [Exiguobacterium phage vB_EalM-132]AYP68690.1 hypothetical protein EalM132_00178 [Exiguobacterium phage vB_EalM-132]
MHSLIGGVHRSGLHIKQGTRSLTRMHDQPMHSDRSLTYRHHTRKRLARH